MATTGKGERCSQIEYADRARGAKCSDIRFGDKVLLKQARDNELSRIFEPNPCVVAHKDRNAFVLQDSKGNCKMRNIAHIKTSVEPATKKIEISKGLEQPKLLEQVVEPAQCDHTETKVIQTSVETQEVLPSNSPRNSDSPRSTQINHKALFFFIGFIFNVNIRKLSFK